MLWELENDNIVIATQLHVLLHIYYYVIRCTQDCITSLITKKSMAETRLIDKETHLDVPEVVTR